LNEFLPICSLQPDVHKPCILITSRKNEWEAGIEVIKLKELKVEDSIEFVKKGLKVSEGDRSQDQEIENFVKELQYFPLALQQAISHIEDQRATRKFKIDDYLKKIQKKSYLLLNYS
jgi:hypothetical protein